MKIIAYASSTKPNSLMSKAQYDSALPKNRAAYDEPLVFSVEAQESISCAAEVLAALKEATYDISLSGYDYTHPFLVKLRGVIEKAEGKT